LREVRTNPITGWKSIYAIGPFPRFINEVNPDESEELLSKFYKMITDNHDLQVRFKWRNENDIGGYCHFNASSSTPTKRSWYS